MVEIKQLSRLEKLRVMEEIRLDLRDHADLADVPPARRDLLDTRRQRAEAGEAKILDWNSVKDSIGRR